MDACLVALAAAVTIARAHYETVRALRARPIAAPVLDLRWDRRDRRTGDRPAD